MVEPHTECAGEACQQRGAPPGGVVPNSSTFNGAGNVKPEPRKHCRHGQKKVHRKGKVKCVPQRKECRSRQEGRLAMRPPVDLRSSASRSPKENLKMSRHFAFALTTALVVAAALRRSLDCFSLVADPRRQPPQQPLGTHQQCPGNHHDAGIGRRRPDARSGGKKLGCLGTSNELGELACLFFVGSELPPGVEPTPISTAEQLKTVLEPIYGPTVEVSGGPVGAAPLIVTVPGVSVPTISGLLTKKESEEQGKGRFGDATNKVLSNGGSGRLIVTVTNLGNEVVEAEGLPSNDSRRTAGGSGRNWLRSVLGRQWPGGM